MSANTTKSIDDVSPEVKRTVEQARVVAKLWRDLKEEDSKLRILVEQIPPPEMKDYVDLVADL